MLAIITIMIGKQHIFCLFKKKSSHQDDNDKKPLLLSNVRYVIYRNIFPS
jgi:hypothetical protein